MISKLDSYLLLYRKPNFLSIMVIENLRGRREGEREGGERDRVERERGRKQKREGGERES